MSAKLVITRSAADDLADQISRLRLWAGQTLGEAGAAAYIERLEQGFRASCEKVSQYPQLQLHLNDEVLAECGYRRFIVEGVLACVYRAHEGMVVVEHVFNPKSDYLRLMRGGLADG